MWLFMKTERFPVVEIFDSIDGEGKRTGYMATFVRFAGCNLRCSYCDTAYAWDASQAKEWLSEDNLFLQIRAYPWKRVSLTGGEPMLQPIETLCRRLGDAGYEVNIETNGAAALFLERPDRLFYTMDIKSPSSGEKDRMRWENLSLLTADDVLKFVVGSVEDLRYMETILST